MKVLLTATNGARTSDRTAGGQRDREGRRVMRAAPIFSRSAWSPPEPSVSALRRAGNPQPGIGSRSLPGGPGSWVDPLQVDHGREGPNVDGSAPPTHCTCGASGDAFPDAPPGKSLDTGAISSSMATPELFCFVLRPGAPGGRPSGPPCHAETPPATFCHAETPPVTPPVDGRAP